jgi:non-specific serine/threonine protein kinase
MQVEPYLSQARARLTPAAFQAELEAGGKLSLEQAIAFARSLPMKVAELSRSAVGAPAIPAGDELTPREREIAVLVEQGKTNQEIAAGLMISPRTVEKHVANILSKLDLTSRAQIVRWSIEHKVKQH